ncbi:sensor histidine kinase [Parvularcula marina]|uniref:histidine kinase n=1 Tax=Parvularcula marina TaxID=2292771 RepID=A0A371RJ90_9PROT|nr:sensor histidine kinase [Parvularcula marina]RFB05515.1 HAMP domain-containing protein [Parvularcula marina]
MSGRSYTNEGTQKRSLFSRLRDETGRFPISRLTITILLTQLAGLSILLIGSLRVTQYRDGLIEAKLEGVRAQAQVIASIMATVAAEDANCDLLTADDDSAPCDVMIDSDRVNAIFTRVWPSFEGRVRIFETPEDYDGAPIENARSLLLQDQILRTGELQYEELPDLTPAPASGLKDLAEGFQQTFVDTFIDPGLRQAARRRTLEEELTRAFLSTGEAADRGADSLRYNEAGELVASVSVPIRKVQAVYGVVTAEIGGIDKVLDEARAAHLNFFLIAAIVAGILSIILTMTIAAPIRKLARAADKVRDGLRGTGKLRLPEFPNRRDEIGELSDSLRSMTLALHNRIEVIDHFAADVSHELKNPLTSIRSAIETLDLANTPEARARLLAVIANDVARMDRLITDISNASRLDADLARESREAVDIAQLLRDIVETYNMMGKTGQAPVRLLGRFGSQPLYIFGSPSTLGQVFRNLIDNALSFSPQDGSVRVMMEVERDDWGPAVRISVADDGPGIPEENLESIFKRFYTKRPAGTQFGNNSGLGLAICRQIVESHEGRIWAENRLNAMGTERIGAVFHVTIPLRRAA